MSDFEAEFEQKMKRVQPPDGFADAVMARVATTREELIPFPRRIERWRIPLLAAATLLATVIGSDVAYQQHQRRVAETSRAQFEAAMRITGRTLNHVDEDVVSTPRSAR